MKKKGLFLTFCATALLCLTGATALLFTEAETNRVLPERVYVGETVTIPEKSITYNGTEKQASVMITAPNGEKYTTGDVFSAEVGGRYIVEYYAYFDGKKVSLPDEQVIAVRKAADLLTTIGNTTVDEDFYIHNEEIKGVRVSQKIGGGVELSKTIDISKNTKNDLLAEIIVEPTKTSADFSDIYITLTDASDATNSISIQIRDSNLNFDGKGCYVKVAASGQMYAGSGGPGSGYITDMSFGSTLWHSFRINNEESWVYPSLKLYYDYADKAIYMSGTTEDAPENAKKTFIADLDDINFPSEAWKGFSDGKVKIGVSAASLRVSTANFFVLNLGGYDLSQEEFVDDIAPELTIDYEGETNVPMAVAGENYRVFDVVIDDNLDDEVKLDVEAYYLHPNGKKYDVSIVDGYMDTPYGGTYVIYYTATDRTGNETKREVQVHALGDARPIVLTTTDENIQTNLYQFVTIGGIDSLNADGGSGNIRYSVAVYDPEETIVELDNNSFRATKVGQYKVVYTASDYLGQEVEVERTITSLAPEKPIFTVEKKLPDALIKGFSYTFPIFEAKEVNGKNVIVDVSVDTYINGKKHNNAFVTEGESVTVQYIATGETGVTYSEEYVLPVVDGNQGKDQTQYFVGGNVTLTENKEDIAMAFSQAANVSFANALASYNFQTAFAWTATECNFRQMNIKLSDADNKDISVTITLTVSAGKTTISYPNSDLKYTFASTDDSYKLYYDNVTNKIKDIKDLDCGKIIYDDNGALFKGFSDKIYFSVEFISVSSESVVRFSSLNNQALGYRKNNYDNRVDDMEPQIILEDNYSVKQEVGAKTKIPRGNAYDVLSGIKSFTCTVTAPDRSIVLESVPADMIHEIELTQFGVYRIVYTAVDTNGNEASVPRLIRCMEKQAPEFVVNGGAMKTQYALNDTLILPSYTASDNSGKYNVDVMLIMPNGEMRLLTHDSNGEKNSHLADYGIAFKKGENAIALLQKGEYTLRYFAYDDTYNCVTVDFVFITK